MVLSKTWLIELGVNGVAGFERNGFDKGARQDHVARLHGDPEFVQLVGEPDETIEGITHHGSG